MKIFNQPEFIELSTYHNELEKYVNRTASTPGIISILTMGSIKAPGLSDLDIICVVNDNFKRRYAHNFSISATDHRIMLHGPVIIPARLFNKLPFIIYATNLKNIYGSDLIQTIKRIPEREFKCLALAYLLDFTESRFTQYAKSKMENSVDKRSWLTRCWSYVHSKTLCDLAEVPVSNDLLQFIQDMSTVRKNWTNGTKCSDSDFLDLFHHSKKIGQQIFNSSCRKLTKQQDIPLNGSEYRTYRVGNKKIICSARYSKLDVSIQPVKIGQFSWDYITTKAPLEYGIHLENYGFSRSNCNKTESTGQLYSTVLKKRKQLSLEHASFLSTNNLQCSMSAYLGLPLNRPLHMWPIDNMFWLLKKETISADQSM